MIPFRLQTLLIGIAILAICLAWLSRGRQRIADRRKVVEALGTLEETTVQPAWRIWLLGDDSARFAEGLVVNKTEITHADLVAISDMTQLQVLSLAYANVADAALVQLSGLTQVVKLNLFSTPITDAGLVHLKGLTQLQWLSLGYTQVTDAGLVNLKNMTELRELILVNTMVTNEGVDELQKALPLCNISR